MPQPVTEMPRSLRAQARWERLAAGEIPALLVHPGPGAGPPERPVPAVIWMHGRTAHKELDPGRYLRLMRAGLGVCAVDLPGHGERFDSDLQTPERSLEVVLRMMAEIDAIVDDLETRGEFDTTALGVGGMSAGGMAALARLCRSHRFRCVSVEATSGSWGHQLHRAMFRNEAAARGARFDPIRHLEGWREIPVQAFHSRRDQWMDFEGQQAFMEALRERYSNPDLIDFVVFEATGAPYEHVGFGRRAAAAKNRQAAFFRRWLDVPDDRERDMSA